MALVSGFSNGPRMLYSTTKDPANITAQTCLDVSFTGLVQATPDMSFVAWAPSLEANLGICQTWCSTAGTVKVRICNVTAADINPASQTFNIVGF